MPTAIQLNHGGAVKLDVANARAMTVRSTETCALPSVEGGRCPHALCFELKIGSAELAHPTFSIDVMDILGSGRDASFPLMGLFPIYSSNEWVFYTDEDSLTVVSAVTADVWFPVRLEFWTEGSTPKVKLIVNGVESSAGNATIQDWTGILFGANFVFSPAQRSIRNISLTANPSSLEEDFNFPPQSFNTITGSGITATDGLITVDTSSNAYATKNLDPNYGICAECADGIPTPDDTITVDISGVISCACTQIRVGENSSITIGPSFDGEYMLTFTEDIAGPIFRFIDYDAVVGTQITWRTTSDCTGDRQCCDDSDPCTSTVCVLQGISMFLHYNTVDQLWTFYCFIGFNHISGFLYQPIGLITDCWGNGVTQTNQVGCASPLGVSGTGAMTEGDITISW